MIESESEIISDDELDIVVGGRKAGEGQKDFSTVSPPPTPIQTIIGWIIAVFK
ncbi:hypothetical protein [Bradyrhizobium sp. AUGA SZCCT0042]|uniref:hypothetical protein n=1 Tax=Bradyrhizobium sp. AUGA SZCCT0042 TaxID=2807651 RepID=UPI001BA5D28B|nr:hypothetical protein [Bradyrhizobium sp. AUGA SZCCT0042]MBR1298580.1 hypothetical protein [Bradyrhizobium sp. AUGA SZCCT0042]